MMVMGVYWRVRRVHHISVRREAHATLLYNVENMVPSVSVGCAKPRNCYHDRKPWVTTRSSMGERREGMYDWTCGLHLLMDDG